MFWAESMPERIYVNWPITLYRLGYFCSCYPLKTRLFRLDSTALAESMAYEDQALARALLSQEPYVLSVFGRLGTMSTQRVLNGLSEPSDSGARKDVFVRGGLVPVRTLRARLAAELTRLGKPLDGSPSWPDLIRIAADSPGHVLVFDEAHLIAEVDRRFVRDLALGWKATGGEKGRLRMVLISDDRRFLGPLMGSDSPFFDPLLALRPDRSDPRAAFDVGLLPYGALARACPRWSAVDIIRGYAVFGGQPEVLRWLEPDRRLGWNVTRLLLSPSGALFDRLPERISARFQKTGRYGAVLSALANGARTWQEVVRSTPEFGAGSPMGAYMKRLEERGLVAVRDPLDAPPGSRRKRYALADAFDGFWFRLVAPLADRLRSGRVDPAEAWETDIVPRLDAVVRQVLPDVGRQYVERYAASRLGSETRIAGGLWGDGYDFDVAATLKDGSVVYGHCSWVDRSLTVGALHRALEELRETRFGFGRERRTMLLLMKEPPSTELELAVLRYPNVEWLDAERLVSAARTVEL